MLTDDDLTRLLGETAESYPVPDFAPLLDTDEVTRVPLLRRRSVRLLAVAASVVTLGAVAVAAGGGPDLRTETSVASDSGGGVPTGGTVGPPALGSTGTTTGGAATSTGTTTGTTAGTSDVPMAPQPAAVAPQLPYDAGAAATASSPVTAEVATDEGEARVVKTGSITLVAPDGKVSETVDVVTQLAKRAKGYVSNATSTEYGDAPSASVTLRVPSAQFETVVDQVRRTGAKVVSAETSGKDVTATYADTEAQIASLKAARARFLTILAGARTIGETLTVQQRVDDVQGRIDRLEGQRRVLANQSDLATLTVTVSEKVLLADRVETPSGLSSAWDDAKDGFTSGVEGIVARSGRALLVVLVGIPLLFLARLGWRLARRRLV